jgi:hypothetical protein
MSDKTNGFLLSLITHHLSLSSCHLSRCAHSGMGAKRGLECFEFPVKIIQEEAVKVMRFYLRCAFAVILLSTSWTITVAQDSIESLRSQLSDAQKKEEELRGRITQLDEDMRPENIERFFALNGSTRPEELRAQRRRQLENEKARVQAQLDQLTQSRVRLETTIATAEAAAYRQSALPPDSYRPSSAVSPGGKRVTPKQGQRRARNKRRVRRRG